MKNTILLISVLFSLTLQQARGQTSQCISLSTPGYEIRSIKCFGAVGDGIHDDSKAFQYASTFFNSRQGHGKLIIPPGIYLVGTQVVNAQRPSYVVNNFYRYGMFMLNINGCSDLTIEGTVGAVIKYRNGLLFGTFEANGNPCQTNCDQTAKVASIGSFFNIINSQNITIIDLELDGNNSRFQLGGSYSDGYQIDHDGIFIGGACHNISAIRVRAHHFGRDGIQVGYSTPSLIYSPAAKSITLRDSSFEYNGRQGLSWIGGKGLTAYNCKFNYTGHGGVHSNPGAGVDFEAESGDVSGGYFENCEFNHNGGPGIIADKSPLTTLYVGLMKFNHSRFQGNSNYSVFIRGNPGFSFDTCQVAGPLYYVNTSTNLSQAVSFTKTSFSDDLNGQEQFPGASSLLEMPNFGAAGNANYAYFNDCSFTALHKRLMTVLNSPYGPGNCAYEDLQKLVIFRNSYFSYDADHTPADVLAISRAISFRGDCSIGTTSSSTTGRYLDLRDVLFQGDNSAGSSTLRASATTYVVGCAGLAVGIDSLDAQDLTVEAGNTLYVNSQGQLSINKKARIIVKAGGTLYLNQSSQLFLRGQIRVQDSATVVIHPSVEIYGNSCENELYLDPGATVLGRTNFTGTYVNVTGGHTGIVADTGCPNSIQAPPPSAQVVVYPNPFQGELTLNLPAAQSSILVNVLDRYGQVVFKQSYKAGTTQIALGRELPSGLYSLLIQSADASSVRRIEKN